MCDILLQRNIRSRSFERVNIIKKYIYIKKIRGEINIKIHCVRTLGKVVKINSAVHSDVTRRKLHAKCWKRSIQLIRQVSVLINPILSESSHSAVYYTLHVIFIIFRREKTRCFLSNCFAIARSSPLGPTFPVRGNNQSN